MSSAFSSATTAPTPYRNLMGLAPDHANDDPRYQTRRALRLLRDHNAAGVGASRSRSRSRPGGTPTRMSRTPPKSRKRNKSVLGRAYRYTPSKQIMFLSLLALVNILLSWFGFGIFSYSGPSVRSIVGSVETPQRDSIKTSVRHSLCQIPLVPRILHCDVPTGTGTISRPRVIQYAIPGIVFALSENLNAVDDVLDVIENMKKQFATMREDIPFQFKQHDQKETISTLLNSTIDIEHQILE